LGAGARYGGLFDKNIDADPSFVYVTGDNYRLSAASQCIGAGADSVEVSGAWYRAPRLCYAGLERPSPAGSNPDLGACENLLGSPLVGVDRDPPIPAEHALYQNYPNPFNPATTIEFQIPQAAPVRLEVFDLLGQKVATVVDEIVSAGVYRVPFVATDLPSGTYLYRLSAGNFIQTRKLTILK